MPEEYILTCAYLFSPIKFAHLLGADKQPDGGFNGV
jgi:hypothetical protein